MSGTVTLTQFPLASPTGKRTELYQIDWTSDASGNATLALNLYGFLIKVITVPSVTAPTDNYDITLVQNGIDQAASLLVDRDTANTEMVYPVVSGAATPIFLAGSHTFTVANAGNAKIGTAYLYLVES